MKVVILTGQALEVSWVPANDASLTSINYTITTAITNGNHSTTAVSLPNTRAKLSGLPRHSAGRVSVQAMNPGALSDIVTVEFKMVDVTSSQLL